MSHKLSFKIKLIGTSDSSMRHIVDKRHSLVNANTSHNRPLHPTYSDSYKCRADCTFDTHKLLIWFSQIIVFIMTCFFLLSSLVRTLLCSFTKYLGFEKADYKKLAKFLYFFRKTLFSSRMTLTKFYIFSVNSKFPEWLIFFNASTIIVLKIWISRKF